MNEAKRTIARLSVYYLLLLVNVFFSSYLFSNYYPTRNITTIYLLILSFSLIIYYSKKVPPKGNISILMKLVSWMGLLLLLLRGIKYSAFPNIDVLARHSWYLYYLPILLIPLFFFYISLFVSKKENEKISKWWHLVSLITLILIVLV